MVCNRQRCETHLPPSAWPLAANSGCELARHPAAQSLDLVTRSDYDQFVKVAELRRWLRKQGCSFVEESRHTRIILGSKVSRMPRHPAKEIKKGTLQSILRDLGLNM